MSGAVQSLAWAMSIRGLDASSFRVLIALVNRANHNTGECFPSHRLIAEDCEMSVATVKRVQDRLVGRGVITVHQQTRDNGSKTSNRYRLAIAQDEPPIAQNEPSPQLTGEPSITRNNKHTSRAKALSVSRTLDQFLKAEGITGLAPVEWSHWAQDELGWTAGQATMEVARFVDSCKAHDRKYKDWMAAWRNWCRSPYCKTVSPAAAATAYRNEPLRV